MGAKDCLHVPCSCPVDPEQEYCSDRCRADAGRASEASERRCDCGHMGCLGEAGSRGEQAAGRDLTSPPE